jgi:hypothetical protein
MLRLEKDSDSCYQVFVETAYIGDFLKDVDGYFYYWPPPNQGGCFVAWLLRALADKLDEINKDWNEQVGREVGPIPNNIETI